MLNLGKEQREIGRERVIETGTDRESEERKRRESERKREGERTKTALNKYILPSTTTTTTTTTTTITAPWHKAVCLTNKDMTTETKQVSHYETYKHQHHEALTNQVKPIPSSLFEADKLKLIARYWNQTTANKQPSLAANQKHQSTNVAGVVGAQLVAYKQQQITIKRQTPAQYNHLNSSLQSNNDKLMTTRGKSLPPKRLSNCCSYSNGYSSKALKLPIVSCHYFVVSILSFIIVQTTFPPGACPSGAYAAAARPTSPSQTNRLIIAPFYEDTSTNQHSLPQGRLAADVVALREGADLDLSCPVAVQNEDMIISWTCDDEPANIRSSRIHVTDSGKLRIKSAKVGDSCNYRCEAADGYSTLSVIIKVIIVDRRMMEQLGSREGVAPANGTRHGATLVAPRSKYRQSTLNENKVAQPSQRAEPMGQHMEDTANNRGSNSSDIEVYIEPSQVRVAKNKTFNLECRVVPPASNIQFADMLPQTKLGSAHFPTPQIIWLKEHIGPKPSSLSEALDQNLLLLDDVYYHSLNWPRSITYSQKSTGSSSALLIRQSSYIHSGRYVCFAGYPPPSMAASIMSSIPANSEEQPPNHSINTNSTNRAVPTFKPVRFRLAHAIVKVDDEEGEARQNLASSYSLNKVISNDKDKGAKDIKTTSANGRNMAATSDNPILRVITRDSWMRNLTIGVTLVSVIMILIQFVRVRRGLKPRSTSQTQRATGGASDRHHENQDHLGTGETGNLFRHATATYNNGNISMHLGSQRHQPGQVSITRPPPIDENLLKFKLNECIFDEQNRQTEVKSLDHIYSEINTSNN